jgi:hypothetical protein
MGWGSFKNLLFPEPLGQFHPDLAQILLSWRECTFVQIKGITLLQGVVIAKE